MSRHSSRPLKCVCHLLCMLKCAPCSSCLLNQFDSYSSFTFWILLLLSKIIKEYQNSNGGGDSLRLKTILLRDHVHKALFYTNKSECFRTYRPLVIIPIHSPLTCFLFPRKNRVNGNSHRQNYTINFTQSSINNGLINV